MSRPVATRKEKAQVGAISAHNDPAIGELVADAMEKVGGEGVITVEESKTTETVLEVVEGMQFDRGFLSPYFVTDAEKMEAVLEDAVHPALRPQDQRPEGHDSAARAGREIGRPLLVVAEDVEGEALATLIVNQIRGVAEGLRRQGARLRRPAQGDAGGHGGADRRPGRSPRSSGSSSRTSTLEQLGRAKRVVVDKDNTTIIGGAGDKSGIDGRIEQIRREIEKTTSDYDREKLQERLAKLSGGVAVIRVGAPVRSGDEIQEGGARRRHQRHQGGGRRGHRARAAAWRCCAASQPSQQEEAKCEGDERTGVQILKRALEAPTRQIAENSAVDGGVVVARMLAGKGNFGFDAARKEYVDLVEAGIIDPTKVVRVALENAVSVASVLLLTEATMTEIPEAKKEAAAESEMAL